MPPFVSDPPMTLDDSLSYRQTTAHGVPGRGLHVRDDEERHRGPRAARRRRAPRRTSPYLSLLPALLREVGVVRDGVPIPYDAMSDRLRREVLDLDVELRRELHDRARRAGDHRLGRRRGGDAARPRVDARRAYAAPTGAPRTCRASATSSAARATQLRDVMSGPEEYWAYGAGGGLPAPGLGAAGAHGVVPHARARRASASRGCSKAGDAALRRSSRPWRRPARSSTARALTKLAQALAKRRRRRPRTTRSTATAVRASGSLPARALAAGSRGARVARAGRELGQLLADLPDALARGRLGVPLRRDGEGRGARSEGGARRASAACSAPIAHAGQRARLDGRLVADRRRPIADDLGAPARGARRQPAPPRVTHPARTPDHRSRARPRSRRLRRADRRARQPQHGQRRARRLRADRRLRRDRGRRARRLPRGQRLQRLGRAQLLQAHLGRGPRLQRLHRRLAPLRRGCTSTPIGAPICRSSCASSTARCARRPADPRFVDYAVANTFCARTGDTYEQRAAAMATDLVEGVTPRSRPRVPHPPARAAVAAGPRRGHPRAPRPGLRRPSSRRSAARARALPDGALWFAIGPEAQLSALRGRAARGPRRKALDAPPLPAGLLASEGGMGATQRLRLQCLLPRRRRLISRILGSEEISYPCAASWSSTTKRTSASSCAPC